MVSLLVVLALFVLVPLIVGLRLAAVIASWPRRQPPPRWEKALRFVLAAGLFLWVYVAYWLDWLGGVHWDGE